MIGRATTVGSAQRAADGFVASHIGGQIFNLVVIQTQIGGKPPKAHQIGLLRLIDHHPAGNFERTDAQHQQRHDRGDQQVADELDRDVQA